MNNAVLKKIIDHVYATNDGPSPAHYYHEREGTQSALIITITDPADAQRVVDGFREEIRDKEVIEVGAGVGLLSFEMAYSARRVWAIENDPSWTYAFTKVLYKSKPQNLHWIFAPADAVPIRGDVAVIRTCSGARSMLASARSFAPRIVFSVWDECYAGDAKDSFLDEIATFIDERRDRIMATCQE
jgi:hypothetical protein